MQQPRLFNDLEERMLFDRLAAGDIDAFSILFHHHNKRIYPFVLSMIKSEPLAEEIVQDIFTQLWIKREDTLNWDKPQAYLFKMATNRTVDQLRKIARENQFIIPLPSNLEDVAHNETEAWLDRKETMQLIQQAVSTLPPQAVKSVSTFSRTGLVVPGNCRLTWHSVRTVQAHLQEATKQIKAYLGNKPGSTFALLIFVCLFEH